MKTRMLYKSQKIEYLHTMWNREYNLLAYEMQKSKKFEEKEFFTKMLAFDDDCFVE